MLFAPEHDRSIAWRAGALTILIGLMWLTAAVQSLLPAARFSMHGIIPRSSSGITGILVAPFIHADFQHLVSNTIPFAILGALILLRGLNELAIVFQIGILVAGGGTWLFGAPRSHHIGASGLVFAFTGFLLFRSVFDRRISSAVITLGVLVAYGGAIGLSILPEEGISWSGHAFGFIGGVLAARFLYGGRRTAARPTGPKKLHLVRRDPNEPRSEVIEEEVGRWIRDLEKKEPPPS
ncbi:MAG TPA: rhomboid family intramembrane serine protease [Thermoanaerobaculia bacterium]|nr:rhomboid family intramembrane serine protease [Thermoanaerobaculia bacterium]